MFNVISKKINKSVVNDLPESTSSVVQSLKTATTFLALQSTSYDILVS